MVDVNDTPRSVSDQVLYINKELSKKLVQLLYFIKLKTLHWCLNTVHSN